MEPGTALRDAACAVTASVVAGALLTWWLGPTPATAAGALTGVAVTGAAGTALVARAGRWSGPADRVTLTRAVLIGGCAFTVVPILAGALAPRPWLLAALVVPALALDAVDGVVARRTGTASAAGARLDMEMDAVLLLVLSLVAIRSLGWWVLAVGGMRYAFVAAGRVRPALRDPLPSSRFRRFVGAVQGVVLAAALAPATPLPLGQAAVAAGLAVLLVSFGRDVVGLERRYAARPGAVGGSPAPGARAAGGRDSRS